MSAGPRRLVLLRHGQTQSNVDGVWQGHLDVELTDTGRAQAHAAGAALAAYRPVRLVCSDLQRALVTAQAVGDAAGLEPEVDPRWREYHVGQWQGLTTAEVIARHPEERLAALRGEDLPRGIDGESPGQVAERVRPALAELAERLGPGECGIVVSHGGTVRVMLSVLLGIDNVMVTRLFATPGNCQWSELVETDTGWRLVGYNLRPLSPVDPEGGAHTTAPVTDLGAARASG